MPSLNLGPGVDQHVNLSFTPTWVFSPTTGLANTLRLYNEGRNTVYVGQADVTVSTGLPLAPGCKPLLLTNIQSPIYAVSAVTTGAVAGTIAVTQTAGTTSFTFPSAAVTALPVGTAFVLGSTSSTSNQEVLVVATSASTTTITTTLASVFPHVSGDQAFLATPTYGQIRATAGVV
jgi:hypothetical protein